MGARDFLVPLKDPVVVHMESAEGLVLGGVASVKNSRRLDKCPNLSLSRRSVLDTQLNPQWFHSDGLRELGGPGHAPH